MNYFYKRKKTPNTGFKNKKIDQVYIVLYNHYEDRQDIVFGIFFIFIHMTRFYTKNSQLNSTNLH